MPYSFNADEVFEMAIRIEDNGARFYKVAAAHQSDAENIEFLEKLATMEGHHKLVFEKMRKALTDVDKSDTVFDPLEESADYLAAMADAHRGEGSPSAADALKGNETMAEIIDIAIGLEKESILFYIGLKEMVSPKYGQDKLEGIIAEEQKHIVQLSAFRKKAI